jgi:NADPH-dependent curcumin reductase CurA
MTPLMNRQVRLLRRPESIPQASDFELVSVPLAEPAEGQIRVRNHWLSIEPAMRGWVAAVANYSQPVGLGEVMRSYAAGVVEASKHPGFPVGSRVTGLFGWQAHAVVDASAVEHLVQDSGLPLSCYLGVMGINGVTAHYGLLELGQPRAGETVVVSTAAGSVGSCVGQMAKIRGCRTVGIAGGPAKLQRCLDTFGFDAAVDYKSGHFAAELAEALVGGVDVYYDNTAGAISDQVMQHLKPGARIVICGTASVSSWNPAPQGPRVERHLLVKRARMMGFVIFDHPEHYAVARQDLAAWIRDGRLVYQEDILDGLEAAPDAIAGLYRGENQGKRLIRLVD